MIEHFGNCVINLNGAAFRGTVMYSPGSVEDEIPAAVALAVNILDDFKKFAAEKLNCEVSDIEVSCELSPDDGVPFISLINGSDGGDGGGGAA